MKVSKRERILRASAEKAADLVTARAAIRELRAEVARLLDDAARWENAHRQQAALYLDMVAERDAATRRQKQVESELTSLLAAYGIADAERVKLRKDVALLTATAVAEDPDAVADPGAPVPEGAVARVGQ